MKLLITGGAGFIGSNFIHYWLEKHPDDMILNLDKLTYAGHPESLKDLQDNHHYMFMQGDICEPAVVERAMQSNDVAFGQKWRQRNASAFGNDLTEERCLAVMIELGDPH